MTAETYDDLKMYVGSKDDFTDDLLNMGYTKGKKDGRAEVIDECIKIIVNTPTKIKIEHYRENDILVDRQNEIIGMLEQLKGNK